MFVDPMLAHPMLEGFRPEPGAWVAEEKLDGHRIVVCVSDQINLFGHQLVRAWSRDGKDRILSPHIRKALEDMPAGVYDGELTSPGLKSYGVTELVNVDRLVYTVFDVVQFLGRDLVAIGATLEDRQRFLFEILTPCNKGAVRTSAARPVDSLPEVEAMAKGVWADGGEGLILKRRASLYRPGKRSKDWLKVKQLHSAVMTVIGFREGKLGPHSVVCLRDDDGFETTVKALNTVELMRIEADPVALMGRKLWVEYQERTPDGNYRHPRWDRWAEGGE